MNEWIFWLVTAGVGLAISTVGFFIKRTLDNLETNQKNLSKQMLDFQAEQTKSTEAFQEKILDKIETKNEGLNDKIDQVSNDLLKFKEHVALNYTKQEDFTSETRDINQKLDKVYASTSKIEGMLENMKGAKDER